MSYTTGNWTADYQTVDSVSDTKNLPIPDLSYASDYTLVRQNQEEAVLANKTGSSMLPVELLRYGRQRVPNVYENGISRELDIPAARRVNVTEGIRAYAEMATTLKATNSVSGEEVILPLRLSIAAVTPTVDIVTTDAFTAALKRGIATMFGTGVVDGSLAINIVRGDLNPCDEPVDSSDD